MLNPEVAVEVWRRLSLAEPLNGLVPESRDGHFELNGITAPRISRSLPGGGQVEAVGALVGIALDRLEFRSALLEDLTLKQTAVTRSRFDRCQCRRWRMWSSSFEEVEFVRCSFGDAMLGALSQDGHSNCFSSCRFVECDLRNSHYQSAVFDKCLFENCKIDGVEFNGSIFTEVVVVGALRDVIFAKRAGGKAGALQQRDNSMRRVDFSRASLYRVEFRELDLDEVVWPSDDDHIVVTNYRDALVRVSTAFGAGTHRNARRITTMVNSLLRWAGPHQETGIVSVRELSEAAGEDFDAVVLLLREV